jgi:hypothetical protein
MRPKTKCSMTVAAAAAIAVFSVIGLWYVLGRGTAVALPTSSAEEARSATLAVTGLANDGRIALTATPDILKSPTVPFMADTLRGREVWQVEITGVRLCFGVTGSRANRYVHRLSIILTRDSGVPVLIESPWPANQAPIAPFPPREEEERQMTAGRERFSGPPSNAPRVSFLAALNEIHKYGSGFGSPVVAKQIRAYYALHTNERWSNRAVWVVQLRGIPAFTPFGPEGFDPKSIPVDQRNHIRNLVDAMTGKWLEASTTPQPVQLAAPS